MKTGRFLFPEDLKESLEICEEASTFVKDNVVRDAEKFLKMLAESLYEQCMESKNDEKQREVYIPQVFEIGVGRHVFSATGCDQKEILQGISDYIDSAKEIYINYVKGSTKNSLYMKLEEA